MNERIKFLRKTLKLSQADFGEKLGVSRDVINNMENKRVVPANYMIKLIASTFEVNQIWLETGEGEMFYQPSLEEEYAILAGKALGEQDPKRKKILECIMKTVLEMPPETYDAIIKMAKDIVESDSENEYDK